MDSIWWYFIAIIVVNLAALGPVIQAYERDLAESRVKKNDLNDSIAHMMIYFLSAIATNSIVAIVVIWLILRLVDFFR